MHKVVTLTVLDFLIYLFIMYYIITALSLHVCFSPTKITLIGAVLFALQQTHYLPLQKHHLMLIYTVFTVVNKVSLLCRCLTP